MDSLYFMKIPNIKNPWLLGAVVGASLITAGTVVYTLSFYPDKSTNLATTPVSNTKISALGRLEPETKVLKLAPPSSSEDDRLLELRVEEGETVKAGDIIAVLDSRDRLQNEQAQAQAQVTTSKYKLAQVRAGAKTGEINAQVFEVSRLEAQRQGDLIVQRQSIAKLEAQLQGDLKAQNATLKRLSAELRNAQVEYQRYKKLHLEGATSQSFLDSKRLSLDTIQEQVNEAQAILSRTSTIANRQRSELQATLTRTAKTSYSEIDSAKASLEKIAEVRPVDIQVAQSELANATSTLKRAETALEKSYIRAPIAGQVLRINSHAGEKPSDKGIIELAQTDQMIVVAEVYQTDIAKVKSGQSVTVTSQGFSDELEGEVYQVGRQVSPQIISTNQPGENLDRRVVEVKVRLNAKARQKVAGLTYLQVQAVFNMDTKTTDSRLK
jgi:HlyD family secretion protein